MHFNDVNSDVGSISVAEISVGVEFEWTDLTERLEIILDCTHKLDLLKLKFKITLFKINI